MTDSAWKPASFRGAPLMVETFDVAGGRRGPDHEFPGKDDGYPEDTGGKIRAYNFKAYIPRSIDSPDYAGGRDALIEALEKEGPGQLVHPVYGTIQVQVRDWNFTEGKNAKWIAVFSLSFRQATNPTYPTATKNAAAGMSSLAASARQATASWFGQRFSVAGRSDYLRDRIAERLQGIGDNYGWLCAMNALPIATDMLLDTAQSVLYSLSRDGDLAMADAVAAFPEAIAAYHEEPWASRRNLDGTYRGSRGNMGNGPLSPLAVTGLVKVYSRMAPTEDILYRYGSIGRVEQTNATAIDALARQATIIEAARVAPFVNWQTLDDAESTRDTLAEALYAEAESADDDEVYRSLAEIRVLVLRCVTPDGDRLPRLADYTPSRTMPSLALTYALYGSSDQADDLVSLNGLRHPGFIQAAEPIRVLSHA